MKLGIDIDNVISNFNEKLLSEYIKHDKEFSPYIGKKNKLEFVEEEKLEVVCDVKVVKRVISKLREIHPYEEPAIDIIPLIDEGLFE